MPSILANPRAQSESDLLELEVSPEDRDAFEVFAERRLFASLQAQWLRLVEQSKGGEK